MHQFDKRNNGTLVRYQGYIIDQMIERKFEKDNCVVSQVFHAIWLYEHKMEFSIQELIDKFLKILKNVYAFEFKDDQHLSLLLFVLKNVQKCLSTFENFQIFVKQLNELNLNSKVMDALESWKHRLEAKGMAKGEAKGMAKGLAKGKAESVLNVAKSLLKMGLFPLENIAEATNLSLGKLKELQASLQ
jgi:predicted transposase/invertase (TIGR01784 family)